MRARYITEWIEKNTVRTVICNTNAIYHKRDSYKIRINKNKNKILGIKIRKDQKVNIKAIWKKDISK